MIPVRNLAGRPIAVAGAGRSGLAVTRFLLARQAEVRVTDAADTPVMRAALARLAEEFPRSRLSLELGGHTRTSINGSALLITSPGVKPAAPPLTWAREAGIPIASELEFASWFCPCPIIAVTGTNGKSTTTAAIGDVLTAAGKPAVVCGNIGFPLTAALRTLTVNHLAVVEVSSFQMEHAHTFHPHIAVLLNVSPNHLDHHASMDDYVAMKYRLLVRQTPDDWTVLNADDPLVARAAKYTRARVVWWGRSHVGRNGLAGLSLAWHPVYRVGELLGVPSLIMRHVFAQFKGLPHRQEVVGATRAGVRFVNDSKSTTPASLQWALESATGPLILIAGGRNKGLDFAPVAATIARLNATAPDGKPRVRAAVLIGELQQELGRLLSPLLPTVAAGSLHEAAHLAQALACPGDTVLLSPGCASFDMFRDFEDRGDQFKSIVATVTASSDDVDREAYLVQRMSSPAARFTLHDPQHGPTGRT